MKPVYLPALLQFFSLLFCFLAIARLVQLRLIRAYPLFVAFLCISMTLQSVAVLYGTESRRFFYAWVYLEPVRSASYVLVVCELFSAVFRNYSGLHSLSRWMMGLAAAVAPVGLVLALAGQGSHVVSSSRILRVVKYERGITFGLAIFIIILLYFISKYPIKLARNTATLCILYSTWFLADSALLLSISFLPAGYIGVVNNSLAAVEIAFYIGCNVLLSKAGETWETRVRRNISPERERLLIAELSAMNDMLLRVGISY